MATLWDLELELKAIKTILTPSSPFALKLYGACTKASFYHRTTRTLYERLQQIMETAVELPSLGFLVEDSQIPKDIRDVLQKALAETSVVETQGDFDYVLMQLQIFTKVRTIYEAAQTTGNDILQAPDPGAVNEIAERLYRNLAKAETDDLQSEVSFGAEYNDEADECFYRVVYGENEGERIPFGFKVFDERTGGFRRTNLAVFAASSGGGKSLLSVNMMIRQYRLGLNVVMASYEMSYDEIMVRLLANIAEVPMADLVTNRLTPKQRDRIETAYQEFNLLGRKKGNTFTILCPTVDTTVAQIGFWAKPRRPDSLILDYINLLAYEGSAEAQWQVLGEIAKQCKGLARKLNCLVSVLAQLDDAYNLRYSKAIKDHANFLIGWVRDETSERDRVITMRQLKARNAPRYDFTLLERFDIAQFRDEDQVDRTDWADPAATLEEAKTLGLVRGKRPAPQASTPEPTPPPKPRRRILVSDEEDQAPAPSNLIRARDLATIENYDKIKLNLKPRSLVTALDDGDTL